MTKQNPYVIPNENYKKTEVVQELKNEVLSYEEFMNTYEGNVNYADLEDGDISVNRGYGPGNSQSSGFPPFGGGNQSITGLPSFHPIEKKMRSARISEQNERTDFVVKTVLKTTAMTALTTSTGGLFPLVGGGAWVAGRLLESGNNEFLQFLGKSVSDVGIDMFSSGIFANSTVGEFAGKIGIDLKKLEKLFEIKGKASVVWAISEHDRHRNEGQYYKSDCEVCNL